MHVSDYNKEHKLTVYFVKEEDNQEIDGVVLLYCNEFGMNYVFGRYNYICYSSDSEASDKCKELNYYLVSDISSLINAIAQFSDLQITVSKNLVIPLINREIIHIECF